MFGQGKLYGHDDRNPQGLDRHIALRKSSESIFLHTSPFLPPLGVLTRLVSGNILRINSLFSKQDDINRRMKEFYARLLVLGYQRDLLIPTFTKGITRACAFIKRVSVRGCVSEQDKDTQGCVFFHMPYHPRKPT